MDENRIRERIRSQLAVGRLKTHDGMIVAAASRAGQPCSACGLPIDPVEADEMPYGHAYPGCTHWFHVACHALWDEEREPEGEVREGDERYIWYTASSRRYSVADV